MIGWFHSRFTFPQSPKSGKILVFTGLASLQSWGFLPQSRVECRVLQPGIIKSVCVSIFSTTGIWILHFGGKECRQLATNNLPGKADDADGFTVTQVSDGSPAMLAYKSRTMVLVPLLLQACLLSTLLGPRHLHRFVASSLPGLLIIMATWLNYLGYNM